MGFWSDLWEGTKNVVGTVVSTVAAAAEVVIDVSPVGLIRDGVRLGYTAVTGGSVSDEFHSIVRGRAIRLQGAVDGVGGAGAGIIDLVAGNNGNEGAQAWLHQRTRNLFVNYADMNAQEREMFNNTSRAGDWATYAIPFGGGWRAGLVIGGSFLARGIYNGVNGVDSTYTPEEPPLPGSTPTSPSASLSGPAPLLRPAFATATGAPINWASPDAYMAPNGTPLPIAPDTFATYTGNGFTFPSAATPVASEGQSRTDATITPIFRDSVQNNGGYLSNEAINDLNTRVRSSINPANITNDDRFAYQQDVIRLSQDLERNPPSYTDERVARLQAALYALGQDIKVDGIMGSETQTASNNFVQNMEAQFRASGVRSDSSPALPRPTFDLVT